ncbi:MAG: starch-binding protein [Muribaculaceae bacterium]|nr:starch-binding protein [Muribaculaceae bacterium]
MNQTLSRAIAIASLCCALNASAANSYGLQENCQDGTILHCFDWTFNQIKEELPNIAAAGFTSVQTSPCQGNANTNAEWYYAYQPYDFYFADGGIGTKQQLKDLCTEADKYGIKIIVDVVANHLNGNMSYVASRWHDSQYWHTHGSNIDYGNRWQVTHGEIGMRDLNSEHSTVYNAVRAYVDELKSYGVDGIRWDAAKHIGLPSEDCNFWSAVTQGTGMWHYGEILVGPTDNANDESTRLMKEYTEYISVTDNVYGRDIRWSIQGGNAYGGYGNWTARGLDSKKIVYWAESHDAYSNDGGYGEDSRTASVNQINRTYALLASRSGASALYFSRPTSTSKSSIRLGQKGGVDFKNKEVAAVNHFHNAMVGQKDYYVSENGAMAVCREKGVVVVKASGSGAVTISNGGSTVAPGTYKDEITGNTWTVTASTISGTIGSTGIAVVYDYENAGNDSGNTGDDNTGDDSGDTNDGNWTVYFDNSNSNWGTVYAYSWDKSNESNTPLGSWSGTAMTMDSASGYYKISFSSQMTTPMIIFNNGSAQTDDLTLVNNGIYNASGYTGKTYQEGSDDSGNTGDDNTGDDDSGNTDDNTGNGDQLNSTYYATNPDGKVGTNKTINMSFSNGVSSTALSNWTSNELIAQGVARDVAQAIKGVHERPIYDTYSLYAAYDDDYLYLGWQFVYLIWDLYGEGKQPGESKPYNADIRQMIALDLDPELSVEGVLVDGNTIWDADGKYNTFKNGADCFVLFNSKPTSGTPGIFLPNADGKFDYTDPNSCLSFEPNSYGYADGLLPSITKIYGQESFGYDPAVLTGTTGFVDLIGEIDPSAHTFYEMKIPLSKLGITKEYIESNGIGVMHVSTYGQGATGSIPYDVTVFDNVTKDYAADPSSSAEKNDLDVFTYAMARVGKLASTDDGGNTTTLVAPKVTANPASGTTFDESISVTLSVDSVATIYYTTDGSTPSASSSEYSTALTFTETTTLKTYVEKNGKNRVQTFTYTKNAVVEDPTGDWTVYFDDSNSNWGNVYAYSWDNDNASNTPLGAWGGTKMTYDSASGYYKLTFSSEMTSPMIIFHNNSGTQTADLKLVNNGIYKASGYTGNTYQGGGNDDDDDTPANDGTWKFYYRGTNWGNSTVYAYVWDSGNANKQYLGGWPGTTMTKNADGMWEISFTTTDNLVTPMVIFNNGQGGGSNQTADLSLINNGVYEFDGWKETGIDDVMNENSFNVYVLNGVLVIESNIDTQVLITRADGVSRIININAGVNYIDNLPRGFYIVNRKKVIL